MTKINDGGPAYPSHAGDPEMTDPRNRISCGGLSIRDYFAGQALVAIIKAEESADVDSIKERARIRQRNHRAKFRDAKRAYAVADAMLAARSESGQ